MAGIERTRGRTYTQAVNAQRPQPERPQPPREARRTQSGGRLDELNSYAALRRAGIERRYAERRREEPTGAAVAGAVRGGRAASAEIAERAVRNTGRVFVDGDAAFRARVQQDLQRIAPGTTVGPDGLVRASSQRVAGHEQGYRLVDQLLNNPHPVAIGYERGNAFARMLSQGANGGPGRPGRGSGVEVRYDPEGGFKLPVVGPDGRVFDQPADSAVVLAHELAHASHFQRGTRDPRSGAPNRTPISGGVDTPHYVNDGGVIYREMQSDRVRMREEFRTTGFDGYRRADEPTELSIRRELGYDPRASYMRRQAYEPATRLEQIFGETRLRAANFSESVRDGVRGSRNGAAIGGGFAFASTAYEQWRNGEFDAGQLVGSTALGAGTGVAEEVIERVVSGAPSVTSGMTSSTFRLAARQLRGAGVAGAVIGGGFAVYDNFSAYQNGEITGAQFTGRVAGEAVTSAGAGVAGAYVGAVVGSFIPIPVVGTLAGAAIGFGVGWLADKGLRALGVDKLVAAGVEKAVEFGGEVVNFVGDTASSAFNGVKDAVGDFAGGAARTLSSVFG